MSELDDYVSATHYDPNTGKILGQRTGFYRDILSEPYSYILGEGDSHTQYVDTTNALLTIRARPHMEAHPDKTTITADGEDTMTLSSLPISCTVTIGGTVYTVPDGVLEWSTLMPGEYPITISAFPYLDWEGKVTAIAGSA
jgi:hypothetical protein